MKLLIVVDANPIISALIGGASREVFFRRTFKFATSEYTLEEVRKFIPYISRKSGVNREEIEKALSLIPMKIYKREYYEDKIKEAERLIRHIDEKDVYILALALKLNVPLWTNDRHFSGIKEVVVVRTKDLIY